MRNINADVSVAVVTTMLIVGVGAASLTRAQQKVTGGSVKCQWKADWALRWAALSVDYEMSGKDLIDSVKLSSQICRVLGGRPPAEVVHYSGAPSTALRLSDGDKCFAYSGDTEWVEALVPIADGADLFVIECYGYSGRLNGHVTWEILEPRLADLRAGRIMITHMNPTMLARQDEARAAGVLVASDGLVIEV